MALSFRPPSPVSARCGALLALHSMKARRAIAGGPFFKSPLLAGQTAGGIIIPDTAKEKPQEGEVIAVGPGARNESVNLVPST
nr:hypothetical protein [Mesorhizobium hawassense]